MLAGDGTSRLSTLFIQAPISQVFFLLQANAPLSPQQGTENVPFVLVWGSFFCAGLGTPYSHLSPFQLPVEQWSVGFVLCCPVLSLNSLGLGACPFSLCVVPGTC